MNAPAFWRNIQWSSIGTSAVVIGLVALGMAYAYYAETRYLSLNEGYATTSEALALATAENMDLGERLRAERERNDRLAQEVEDISETVGLLDKLSRIDPELLQKYSKVYFLNENYMPEELVRIPEEYTHNGEEEYFEENAWEFLEDLLRRAERDGIDLRVVSGFRSFDRQAELKSGYTVTYGSGANAFSAEQGYSEHQLGTTVDFTTEELGASWSSGFAASEAYEWLQDNAHRYGFVLSYPPDNAYYVFEPWHWRFVGQELARDLDDDDQYFYDLDQREIDEYLVGIFD